MVFWGLVVCVENVREEGSKRGREQERERAREGESKRGREQERERAREGESKRGREQERERAREGESKRGREGRWRVLELGIRCWGSGRRVAGSAYWVSVIGSWVLGF